MGGERAPFIVTVDAEGDDAWSRPARTETRNAAFLPRFQRLCERHGLRASWLAEHAMALDPVFREFGRDLLARGAGEIGMHLHAWETPPFTPLTDDDRRRQPYLTEYPDDVMRAKIERHTGLLEETFGRAIVSHRGGRWAFDERYARMLIERGYRVDCSVTPHVDWRGAPGGLGGGPDHSRLPERPWWVDPDDLGRAGRSPLLEVPVTVARQWPRLPERSPGKRWPLPWRALNRAVPALVWLGPDGRAGRWAARIVRRAAGAGRAHLEFAIHSSELMPGGAPGFPDEAAVEELYARLDALFAVAARHCRPMTLAEFRDWYARVSPPDAACGGGIPGAEPRTAGRFA